MAPLRLFRLLRALKSFRLLRTLRFFQLRLVLLSLFHSVVPLLWCCFTFVLFLFVFSLLFVQLIAGDLHALDLRQDEPWIQVLVPYFRTSAGAMVSLFSLAAGGDDWYLVYDAFSQMDWLAGWVFLTYIVICVLGVMNVIAAVFVEVAVNKARSDETLALEEQQHQRAELAKALVDVFKKIDTDGNQDLSLMEWSSFIQSDLGKEFLTLYKVEPLQAEHMFHLLDIDDSHQIHVEDFVMGFMQLQGAASSLEQHETEMEIRRQTQLLRKFKKAIAEISQGRKSDSALLASISRHMDTLMGHTQRSPRSPRSHPEDIADHGFSL
jgi:hypothetical protein